MSNEFEGDDDVYDDDTPDLYSDDVSGEDAYAEYTVYVDCGEAERKFNEFMASLGVAAEARWIDRHWK